MDDSGLEMTGASDLMATDGVIAWSIDFHLTEDTLYCWQAWATDDEGLNSPVSDDACFLVDVNNEAPSAPTILWPALDDRAWSLTPEIEVDNGVDPEGRTTEHIFELDWDPGFGSPDLRIGTVTSGEQGTTVWSPESDLIDDTVWFLRVTCSDGATTSEQATVTFRVNSTDDPPSEPVLQNPAEGSTVAEGDVFSLVNSFDPDGETLVYEFQVMSTATGETLRKEMVPEDPDGTSAWTPEPFEDGLYSWTARAVDPEGLVSDWATARAFEVATESSPEPEEAVKAEPASFWGCSTPTGSPRSGLGMLAVVLGLGLRRRTRSDAGAGESR
jgi:MYXO-CTERM domain-containing protein